MFSTEQSPNNSPKYTKRRVASVGTSATDIVSYMQNRTGGKREKDERSPENKIEDMVKKKYTEEDKDRKDTKEREEGHNKDPTERRKAQEGAEWTAMEKSLEESKERATKDSLIIIGKKLEQT
ncbi:hypothetical protein QAD02_012417 [Eretmocerus hayati]|uniref:Uncharacterized protein n=1 Tax=Eretmocerus hayati TaxID=131215 RepID=A0ACC2NZC9_9HYME|nr:hypothetical protein QAD02_012417 [Eretmocerus hayati]